MRSINNICNLNTDGIGIMQKTQVVLSGQPHKHFIESLRTQKTKETYAASLKAFMLFKKLSSVEALVSEDVKEVQSHIIDMEIEKIDKLALGLGVTLPSL